MSLAITALDQPDNILSALLIAAFFIVPAITIALVALVVIGLRRIADRAARRRHLCPMDGCTATVPYRRLMCRPHWRLVPPILRQRVILAWRHGEGAGTTGHYVAAGIAVAAAGRAQRAAACPWCARPAGRNLGLLPGDCTCGLACSASYCGQRAVTR